MTGPVTAEMLEGLTPLYQLDAEALEALAAEAELDVVSPKALVYRRGESDPWTRYVLSGEVLLVDRDVASARSIIGMGDAAVAAEPLGMESVFELNALARSEVRLIRLPTERIRTLLEQRRLPDYGVDQLGGEEDGASGRLFHDLVEDLLHDRLELPSMPDIAVRVREAVNNPEAGAAEVTRIIQADPVVAAQLLKAANSALYMGQSSIDSLNGAVVRLGLRQVRELVMSVTMRQVFRSSNPLLNKRMVELWMHSTLVAAIAAVMARRLDGFDADRALLAGLVHDIGIVPMLNNAANYPELAQDPAMLESTIDAYRGDVGAMILRRWNFPEDMIDMVLNAENWTRDHDRRGDYADLIIAAQLQALTGGPGASSSLPALETLPLSRRLGLENLGDGGAAALMDEAREEIAEVQRLLMG